MPHSQLEAVRVLQAGIARGGQRAVAKALGVVPGTVSRLLTGERQMRLQVFLDVCAALDRHPADVMLEAYPPAENPALAQHETKVDDEALPSAISAGQLHPNHEEEASVLTVDQRILAWLFELPAHEKQEIFEEVQDRVLRLKQEQRSSTGKPRAAR